MFVDYLCTLGMNSMYVDYIYIYIYIYLAYIYYVYILPMYPMYVYYIFRLYKYTMYVYYVRVCAAIVQIFNFLDIHS